MSKRVLPRDYTAEEMDRGEGMISHPVDGGSLSQLFYSPQHKRYYSPPDFGGDYGDYDACGRIGDGKPGKDGDPYPPHWKFDPFTGERLK